MTHTPNPYPSLEDARYDAVVNGRYVKSTFSSGHGDCLSFTVADGLIGFQDDKLPPAERTARTLIFTQHELAAFLAGAKNGDFDHLLDSTSTRGRYGGFQRHVVAGAVEKRGLRFSTQANG